MRVVEHYRQVLAEYPLPISDRLHVELRLVQEEAALQRWVASANAPAEKASTH